MLEVIVAFAIAALSIAVLFQTFGTGLNSIRHGGDMAQAMMLADAKLSEFQVASDAVTIRTSGRVGRFHWSLIRKPHARFERGIWHTVTVSWPAGPRPEKKRSVSLTALSFRETAR